MAGQAEARNQAALIRKAKANRKGPKTTSQVVRQYEAPEFIKGIRHVIEGRDIQQTRQVYGADLPKQLQGQERGEWEAEVGYDSRQAMNARQATQKSKGEYDAALARFKLQDEARKRIKPVKAPEAGEPARRRKAARRRMRGRLGTMLSQRETLGSRGTLG